MLCGSCVDNVVLVVKVALLSPSPWLWCVGAFRWHRQTGGHESGGVEAWLALCGGFSLADLLLLLLYCLLCLLTYVVCTPLPSVDGHVMFQVDYCFVHIYIV